MPKPVAWFKSKHLVIKVFPKKGETPDQAIKRVSIAHKVPLTAVTKLKKV
jgi:hypothetical protein